MRYDFITKEATMDDTNSMNNRELLRFHYFNPNGLLAQKRSNDKKISALVNEGKVPSGWILAWGSMNDYSENRLYDMMDKKRVNSIKLHVALDMLKDNIKKATAKIKEVEKT